MTRFKEKICRKILAVSNFEHLITLTILVNSTMILLGVFYIDVLIDNFHYKTTVYLVPDYSLTIFKIYNWCLMIF